MMDWDLVDGASSAITATCMQTVASHVHHKTHQFEYWEDMLVTSLDCLLQQALCWDYS